MDTKAGLRRYLSGFTSLFEYGGYSIRIKERKNITVAREVGDKCYSSLEVLPVDTKAGLRRYFIGSTSLFEYGGYSIRIEEKK